MLIVSNTSMCGGAKQPQLDRLLIASLISAVIDVLGMKRKSQRSWSKLPLNNCSWEGV
jgi:hypothetical protein